MFARPSSLEKLNLNFYTTQVAVYKKNSNFSYAKLRLIGGYSNCLDFPSGTLSFADLSKIMILFCEEIEMPSTSIEIPPASMLLECMRRCSKVWKAADLFWLNSGLSFNFGRISVKSNSIPVVCNPILKFEIPSG